jgi:hypothetical protein
MNEIEGLRSFGLITLITSIELGLFIFDIFKRGGLNHGSEGPAWWAVVVCNSRHHNYVVPW